MMVLYNTNANQTDTSLRKLQHWYELVLINAYNFGISFMWNGIHPIFLPLLIIEMVPEGSKNTGLGLLSSVGLIIAFIIQPLSGALSDATRHKWGRRRPWLLLGTLGDLLFLTVLAFAPNYWVLAVGYLGLQFCSNLAHGANQGLIPDLVPLKRHGEAAGFKNAVEIAGIVATSVIIGRLNRAAPRQVASLLAIGLVLCVVLVVTWIGAREVPTDTPNGAHPKISLRKTLVAYFSIDLKSNKDYVKLMISRFLLLFGTYAVQSFALFYFRDVLRISHTAQLVSRVMATIGLGVLFVAYPAGLLSGKLGKRVMSQIACGLCALGIALFLFIRGSVGVYIAGAIMGLGMGIFLTVNWSWATSLVPIAEAGKYLGLSNLATAGSGAIARLLGPAVDLGNKAAHNLGYISTFIIATLAALGALLLISKLPEPVPPEEDPFPIRGVFLPQ